MGCAPVGRVKVLREGAQRVTSRVGTTVVPARFPRQESPNQNMHCMVRYSHFADTRPVCFFAGSTPVVIAIAPRQKCRPLSDSTAIVIASCRRAQAYRRENCGPIPIASNA
jgi:hypothetical protein